uniref:Myosin-binding protein H-like n=1 Tax=Callithrix jacchus TaxID=9483 RepID=A0A8I3WIX6_CALJA|nr:myosin-binding protein H-like isoform X1 [Callithrix jacchus]XP_009000083.2 myosin-binding protein H-like isoform X1 [Callithrix jacchus]XP_009000084.2 myosin-binding protein H-like isoform X1 [Callithrix jacchus]
MGGGPGLSQNLFVQSGPPKTEIRLQRCPRAEWPGRVRDPDTRSLCSDVSVVSVGGRAGQGVDFACRMESIPPSFIPNWEVRINVKSGHDGKKEHPKIWLPRALRQTYIRKVGDTVNLLIPFQGKPKPQATWTHDGCALDTSRVSVRNGERDSILFIREAQRADSGRYQLRVQLGGLEATATIDILVIERPGPPQSIKLVDVWGFNATLEWTPPQDTGNTALLGYTVQKADTKSGLWFTVLEHYHRTSCVVSDLIIGNSYAFRVFAENQCGLSETAPITTDLAHIQKAATVYKTKGFAQRDFSEAPKFTQPLADCTTVTGYNTQLFCCVRASPRPKIIWLKNKMDIQGNPKYRALTHLGICSLEIRKPGPFDGGIYTCKAVNALGEASVDCRVDVKVPN